MKIQPDQQRSPVQTTDNSRQIALTTDQDLVAAVEVSKDGLIWQTPTPLAVLPAGVATPLAKALLAYKYFRLRIQPIPNIISVTVTKTADAAEYDPTQDLRVPDVIRTRPTTIDRDEAGDITKITREGGREVDFTRDENGHLATWADHENTWTLERDESDDITGVTVE